ncbi:MAG TPA: bifunctional 4-hydroxy-2-oxoglutarate aldolase/2-dehydro-3-deoxy-phosphogluconate aldolase [Streptosporangiaceae bacterium]|nr:bifunctional 4-hydroxy-2-oxoglutarate aldolase/2-dehydro-3-deoxy-phosphogluconate aldolase [Streptosporangiaceae bacterium]
MPSGETPGRAPLPPGLAGCPVIAILRRLPAHAVLPLARALLGSGLRVLELTVDSPDALSMISALRDQLPELTVGGGTVLDAITARRAISAGAGFLVSPHTDHELLDFARKSGVPLIPGAATASEAFAAWKGGAAAVKLFPASVLGVPTLDALRDPLPHVRFIAVGGIDSTNARDFIAHGCAAVGVGSWLVARGDPAEASRRAEQLLSSLPPSGP